MVSQFGSLGYTIMGKTADLTVVQKTIIDTLHKEGKTQTFITKEAVHRVLSPSMLTESWVEGKSVWKKKMHNQLREPQPYEDCQANRFKNLGELHKEWTEAGVKASRAPPPQTCRGDCLQFVIRGVLTWAKRRRTGLLPSGPNSSCQMRARFVFHLETKVLESGGRVEKLIAQVAWSSSVKFPQSVMIGCNVICWCWSVLFFETNVTAPVYQDILEHFMLPSAEQLFKDADFIFQQDLAPVHTATST